ncbi:MAG TPA: chromate resistance protein ChrB domain-containing protein [Vicinamibacterales bacterium]|nr:chromate resistance protein ChrB domain-containing protein [Vicinamibacterales bacterium]
MRTWRRLQQLGALPIKQAVYVLPDTRDTREDFEWLKAEIKAAGGDASVFAADNVDSWSDDALVEDFRRARQDAYAALAREIERVSGRIAATRRPRGTRAPAVRRRVEVFRERLNAIEHIDFFGSAGRDRVATVLRQLEEKASGSRRRTERPRTAGNDDAQNYANRLWVTRPRPGVDRMASAWLIRRFVDPRARFGFAADRESVPHTALPFDMFGVEFSHQGEGCTFETLCNVFAIHEPAVARIASIVHDLDLKDGRFGALEAPTVGTVIEGLQLSVPDDDALLAEGMALFESLYRAFELSERSAGPRPVARSRTRAPSRRGTAVTRRRRAR